MTKTKDFTKHNFKFEQARVFMMDNPQYAKACPRWRAYAHTTLYGYLQGIGARWSIADKVWRGPETKTEKVPRVRREQSQSETPSKVVLVRIIANRWVMDKRLSEFKELCEALNWKVLTVSDEYRNEDQSFLRVYLKIRVDENDT